MPNIFRYQDYRHFLRDCFQERKDTWRFFSHRYLAQKTGFSAGYFSKILEGYIDLSHDKACVYADFFGLYGPQREAFLLMTRIAALKPGGERSQLEDLLQNLRADQALILGEDRHAFYAQWYHTAVREIAALLDAPTPEQISALLFPSVSAQDVEVSLELLQNLGLLQKSGNHYLRTEKALRSGEPSSRQAIMEYAATSIDQAKQALFELPIQDRQIASLVVSVSTENRKKILDLLQKTRREIAEIAASENTAHEVWHINFQAFPHATWDAPLLDPIQGGGEC
jgi:uncharacterized protein (TIGR02147 family)